MSTAAVYTRDADFWRNATSRMQRPAGALTVTAGLDAEQVEAAWLLHTAWAAERGSVMDNEAWADQMGRAVQSGRFNLWVARVDGKPVGVAEAHVVYDPTNGENAVFGERAYVLPEFRRRGVFEQITESIIAMADWFGIKTRRMSAETPGMQAFYARYGYKPVSVLMGVD